MSQPIPPHLEGETSAEDLLNGVYPFPPSPPVSWHIDDTHFEPSRLSPAPPSGVHPRILVGPDDLPDVQRRLRETPVGRALFATLKNRLATSIGDAESLRGRFYALLAAGDLAGAQEFYAQNGFPADIGHYKPFLYAIALEAVRCWIENDAENGARVGVALATYARLVEPFLDDSLAQPLWDDTWRAVSPLAGGKPLAQWMMSPSLPYAYDFAFNWMSEENRAVVRNLIAKATRGRVWMGARLPRHFRNWNWIPIGMAQPLLALAIEGEDGYDPRVYRLGCEILRDYFNYGLTENGVSTEAVGYSQFGLVWSNPFCIAAARRGDTSLLLHSHHRAMLDWYGHALNPDGLGWTSHGDGGHEGPAPWTLLMWRYFFPTDKRAEFLWQCWLKNATKGDASGGALDEIALKGENNNGTPVRAGELGGDFHFIEVLLWASENPKDTQDFQNGAHIGWPLAQFDATRSSLIARSDWSESAVAFQFECRTDSVSASHEHADRGNFTFFALGRAWAMDGFRSVETRYHNSILVDGLGQGYWPGPGKWLGYRDEKWALLAACDTKDAYDWLFPKSILFDDPQTSPRLRAPRWKNYLDEAQEFQSHYADVPRERDTREAVRTHFEGFESGNPGMWDEDGWPTRLQHNPLQRAFRTTAFVRGPKPYLLICDDIQKDENERLYEWILMCGLNTEVVKIEGNDTILCDATAQRDPNGSVLPKQGERQLLVRILAQNEPQKPRDYTSRPQVRLETFDKKDMLMPAMKAGALSGSRSFGLDKRLIVPSRSAAPDFKILLFPHRAGEALPVTSWNAEKMLLTIEIDGQTDEIHFALDPKGRTHLKLCRAGENAVELP